MKIFAYISSYRNTNSKNLSIVNDLLCRIEKNSNYQVYSKIRTPQNTKIIECRGCTSCFISGLCPIKDDIVVLKKEMEESDLIIIATPVFAHNVTGNLKILIDRLAYWTHLFHLKGKLGILIVTSATNGNDYVMNYLNKILEYWGIIILSKISIQTGNMSDAAVKSILDVTSKNIVSQIRKGEYNTSTQQELHFKIQKDIVRNQVADSFEKTYWNENGLLLGQTYQSIFEKNYSIKI